MRIGISAPKDVDIFKEVYQAIQQSNRESAMPTQVNLNALIKRLDDSTKSEKTLSRYKRFLFLTIYIVELLRAADLTGSEQ